MAYLHNDAIELAKVVQPHDYFVLEFSAATSGHENC